MRKSYVLYSFLFQEYSYCLTVCEGLMNVSREEQQKHRASTSLIDHTTARRTNVARSTHNYIRQPHHNQLHGHHPQDEYEKKIRMHVYI